MLFVSETLLTGIKKITSVQKTKYFKKPVVLSNNQLSKDMNFRTNRLHQMLIFLSVFYLESRNEMPCCISCDFYLYLFSNFVIKHQRLFSIYLYLIFTSLCYVFHYWKRRKYCVFFFLLYARYY